MKRCYLFYDRVGGLESSHVDLANHDARARRTTAYDYRLHPRKKQTSICLSRKVVYPAFPSTNHKTQERSLHHSALHECDVLHRLDHPTPPLIAQAVLASHPRMDGLEKSMGPGPRPSAASFVWLLVGNHTLSGSTGAWRCVPELIFQTPDSLPLVCP